MPRLLQQRSVMNKKKLIRSALFFLFIIVFYPPYSLAQPQAHDIKKILLVVAMDEEAAPIIKNLQLNKSPHSFSGLPMKAYTGKYKNLTIALVTNGEDPKHRVANVGTQPGALATFLGIDHSRPDLVISIGTAGGIAEHGAKIHAIYMSEKINFIHRRIPMPGYLEYGIGGYSSWRFQPNNADIKIKTGIVCSSDSFDTNQTDYQLLLKHGCVAKEMEAASVAWVSMLMKVPMVAIKGITDIEGGENSHAQFKENFAAVTAKLSTTLTKILDDLASKKMAG